MHIYSSFYFEIQIGKNCVTKYSPCGEKLNFLKHVGILWENKTKTKTDFE